MNQQRHRPVGSTKIVGSSKIEESSKITRDAAIWGFAGVMFALVGIQSLLSADAWYLTVGAIIMLVGAVCFAARAIIVLRSGPARD
ncbi:hypothetical protein ACFWHR_08930 [Leucobacter sp. NPDC058333]|uniref:hypothetical protein n=1 Tax=Leucobacter sp. NPDC058333 TaxID=3346450 RepID=UPI0036564D9C